MVSQASPQHRILSFERNHRADEILEFPAGRTALVLDPDGIFSLSEFLVQKGVDPQLHISVKAERRFQVPAGRNGIARLGKQFKPHETFVGDPIIYKGNRYGGRIVHPSAEQCGGSFQVGAGAVGGLDFYGTGAGRKQDCARCQEGWQSSHFEKLICGLSKIMTIFIT